MFSNSFIGERYSSSTKGKSIFREVTNSREKDKPKSMKEIAGFNKRKAEGRAKDDTPKKIQKQASKCYVQILGTGMDTQDTTPSVLLFFDKHRFIFNAGEGLQRFCTEHKIKLSKIHHVFLSRVCSETAGGLPGLLLTLAGIGDGIYVDIWGPSIKYLVDAMRSFIPNAAIAHTHSIDRATNVDGASLPDEEPILVYQDKVVKISAVLLHPSFSEGSQIVNGHTFMSSSSSLDTQEKRNRFSEPLLPHSEMLNMKDGLVPMPGNISVIYVCELPEIKGKFDREKAVAHGLKPGPKYSELKSGNRVISDCGNVLVDPTDVLGPSVPGPIILLVDCPTLSHLQELLSLQSFNSYYADSDHSVDGGVKYGSKKIVKSVICIIHLSPSSVAMTVEYQDWMKKFGEAQHIMAGHEINNIETPILIASPTIATRLNYLCPQFFPAPGFLASNPLNYIRPESMTSEGFVPELSGVSRAENLLKFQLRGHAPLGLDRSAIPSLFSPTKVVNELLADIPEIVDASEQLRHLWNDSRNTKKFLFHSQENIIMTEEPWIDGSGPVSVKKLDKQGPDASRDETLFIDSIDVDEVNHESAQCSCLENITREDMEIVLLGTGSSQPSKYRNVSSIYINLFSKGGLLLDCGEGTLGQLKRRLGLMGADDAVKGLRCIWISHIHADHHLGLARVLALRSRLLQGMPHDPLLVVGPMQLERFLDAYQRLEDLDMQFLDCWHTTMGALKSNGKSSLGSLVDTRIVSKILKNLKRVLEEAGLEALISVPVVHCELQAFGLVLKAAERVNSVGKIIPGWKLAYSGDTRPCPELIAAACGATVLIHEATFEDNKVAEAIEKSHSTTKEAIEVGVSAGVYRTILTHFSQRYPKIPVFDEIHMHQTCIAFDLMSINIADLSVLPKVLPYLMLLFRNDIVDDDNVVKLEKGNMHCFRSDEH